MHTKLCYSGQYEEALKEKRWLRLLPYPCQLLKWQMNHPESVRKIGQITAHLHGLWCWNRCENKGLSHPKGHEFCGIKCEEIDNWIKDRLREQVLRILEARREAIGQQVLF